MIKQWFVGRRLFQAGTILAPFLTVLEVNLQQHSFDWWALGSSAIASVLVAIANLSRANVESQVQAAGTKSGGTP